ncbi:MAG: ABC transporter permease [Thermomicrobiales bacterium]
MTASAPWRRVTRMLAVARIETLHLTRDRLTLSLIVAVPAIQIILFGYTINLDPKNVPMAIAGDHALADQLTRKIAETGYFVIVADKLPLGAAERLVAEGKALVGVEIPRLDSSDPDEPAEEPRIIVDTTDPAAVRPALAALESALWRHIAERSATGFVPSVAVTWLYNPEGRTAWVIVPGLVGVIVMISMLMLGALTLVRERERGSWETLLATPVDAVDALVGKLFPYIILGTLQAVVVIFVARLLFDLPVTGALWALLIAVPVYAAAHLILGFAFSALAESQMQAMQGAVFFYLPSMVLSGFMFPFQGMPGWAQTIGEMLPLTHFVRATRGVLLIGADASLVVSEMLPVALFALAAAALALAAYRRRID